MIEPKTIIITETHGKNSEYDSATYEINAKVDGKEVLGFYAQALHDCPEDASLERDLSYAYSAIEFFKLGLRAGKENWQVIFDEFEKAEE